MNRLANQSFLKKLKNKYTIAFLIFFIWAMFLDKNNFYSTLVLKKRINDMYNEKAYYNSKITLDSIRYEELQSDKEKLEKFAREQYFMKKDDEDIFIVVREED